MGRNISQIEQRERDIGPGLAEHRCRPFQNFRGGPCPVRTGRQGAQCPQPTRADHLRGRLRTRAEYTADSTGFVPQRAVGEGEIAFFPISVPVHGKHFVLVEGSSLPSQHRGQHGAYRVPYLRPHSLGWAAHRGRMFGTEHRQVGIVVNLHQLRSPEDHHGEPG